MIIFAGKSIRPSNTHQCENLDMLASKAIRFRRETFQIIIKLRQLANLLNQKTLNKFALFILASRLGCQIAIFSINWFSNSN